VSERTKLIGVRLSPALLERLDALAGLRGVSRSAVLRQLVAEAALAPADAVPGEAELLAVLAERARAGNVAAIRMLLEREAREPRSEFEKLLGVRLAGGDDQ
jgi:predicted transcriptional regulator